MTRRQVSKRGRTEKRRRVTVPEMWVEICIESDCPCFGVTMHWASGWVSHRPFTVRELAEVESLVGGR